MVWNLGLEDVSTAGTDHGAGNYIIRADNENGTPDLSALTAANDLKFSSLNTAAAEGVRKEHRSDQPVLPYVRL